MTLVARLKGDAAAQSIQLMIEYDPAPPFKSGSPLAAAAGLVARIKSVAAEFQARRRAVTMRAAKTLGLS